MKRNSITKNDLFLFLGDVIEITGSTDSGLLEGTLRGQTGFIPRHLVQEVRFRTHKDITASGAPVKAAQPPAAAVSAVKEELMSPKETVKATKQPQHFATVSSKSGLNFVPGNLENKILESHSHGVF